MPASRPCPPWWKPWARTPCCPSPSRTTSPTVYWRRPEFYLDPVIRQASSTFAQLPASVVEPAIAKLHADLASGAWQRRHADLLTRESMDYGYRLLIAGGSDSGTA
ncbi:hypothetical protein [Streptomyces sp. GC420]|uniref:hypothetical protein n=1 Tax=Streptomyces sp. GC420 TaxID=2697568 RepID=UPI001FB5FD91|nr:hypothetical protein [Streptomyces sp. GC420]